MGTHLLAMDQSIPVTHLTFVQSKYR